MNCSVLPGATFDSPSCHEFAKRLTEFDQAARSEQASQSDSFAPRAKRDPFAISQAGVLRAKTISSQDARRVNGIAIHPTEDFARSGFADPWGETGSTNLTITATERRCLSCTRAVS